MQFDRRTKSRLDDDWVGAHDTPGGDSAVPHLYHEADRTADAGEILVERSDFHIRLATTHGHRRQGSMLIRRMYSRRGYATTGGDAMPNANQITLQACGPDGVFGTLSLRLDSPGGLLADELYRDEIDAHRARGASVCELTGFAVERDYGSREVLACLFELIYIYARRRHRCTDLFIEVNPRHVGFYEQCLGFRPAGSERVCVRVGAPAILLHLDLDQVEARLDRVHDERRPGRRSLYRFFMSRQEEEGLARRILDGPRIRNADERDAEPMPLLSARSVMRRDRGPAL